MVASVRSTLLALQFYWRHASGMVAIALSALILGPLLGTGFILTLDMVFTSRFAAPMIVSNSYVLGWAMHLIALVLGGAITEKIILEAVVLMSAFGAWALLRKVGLMNRPFAMASATLAYTINPFIYDRFMAGQYEVLLGYAVLPWFVRALLRFLDAPSVRSVLVLIAWAVTSSIVSIHSIGWMAIVAVISFGYEGYVHRADRAWLKSAGLWGLLGIGVFAVASGYWLVPALLGHGSLAATVSGFGASDRAAFATRGGSTLGRIYNVLQLEGFWAEGRDLFFWPQDVVPFWTTLMGIIWVLVLAGVMAAWRQGRRREVWIFGLTGLAGVVLGAGIGNAWMAAHIPFFAGYREPQKFVVLTALSYAVFFGFGVCWLMGRIHRRWVAWIVGVLIFAVLLTWMRVMLWGFDQQLAPVDYPSGWNTVNTYLDSTPKSTKVLFLPWHLYMYFEFAGRIIANPAPQYFDRTVISSSDPQYRGVAPSYTPEQAAAAGILGRGKADGSVPQQLAQLGIGYVILDRDVDYKQYRYIVDNAHMKLVSSTTTMDLYRNEAYGGAR